MINIKKGAQLAKFSSEGKAFRIPQISVFLE